MLNRFEYVRARSVTEAFAGLAGPGAIAKAGGVDVLDLTKEGILAPARLVSLLGLKELRYIRHDSAQGLHIGPLTTLAEIGRHKLIGTSYPALSQAAEAAATPQIRNQATVGGNLCQRPRCWYFRSSQFQCLRKGGAECYAQEGENKYHAVLDNSICAIVHPSAIGVALTAFGARLKITDGRKERDLAIEEFFVTPETDVERENILKSGQLIVDIGIPEPPRGTVSAYVKLREKQTFDWPLADAAAVLQLDGMICREATIVLGSAAPIPWRAHEGEAVLMGKSISKELAREAARASLGSATPLRDNHYKVQLLQTAVSRAILSAAGINPLL